MSSPPDEEHKLLYLLGKFDPSLAKNCVHRACDNMAFQAMESLFNPRWILGRKTGKPIAYRVQLKTPGYFVLSHPLSRFKRLEDYWVGNEYAKFCAKLGLIPVFLVNVNRFTLLRLWGELAKTLFSRVAEPTPEEGYVHWKAVPDYSRQLSQLPELSSMNFILKQNADIRPYEGIACDCFEEYFTFGFWAFPERGFSNSTIVINDDSAVHFVLKASKSIYIPIETYTMPMDLGLEKHMPVEVLDVFGLSREQTQYRLEKIENVVVMKDIARSLEEEHRRGHFFINGIISEFRRRENRFHVLTAVALYEVSNFELLKSIIGLLVLQKFENGSALSLVGKLEDIKRETESVLRVLLQKASLDTTMADSFPNLFSWAVDSLKPIVVKDEEERVFYMPPAAFVALLEDGLIDRLEKKRENLVSALKILDMMPNASDAEILRSEESLNLNKAGIFPERVLMSLRSALEQIHLARITKSLPTETSTDAVEQDSADSSVRTEKPHVQHSIDKPTVDASTEKEQEIYRRLREEEKKLRKAERDR